MNPILHDTTATSTHDPLPSRRCSQCGGSVPHGRELIVDDAQVWCDGCYRLMLSPDGGGDIPSKWI